MTRVWLPDSPEAFTSEEGWRLGADQARPGADDEVADRPRASSVGVGSALSVALRLVDEHHRRCLLYTVAQQTGVPIRQPNATVGFGFADL